MLVRFGFQSFVSYRSLLCSIDGEPGAPAGGGGAAPSGPSGDSLSSFRGSEPSGGASQSSQTPAATAPGGSDAGSGFDFLHEVFDSPTPSTTPGTPAQAAPAAPPAQAPAAQPSPPQPGVAPVAQPAQAPAEPQAQPGQPQQQPAVSPQFDPADPVSLARGLVENYDAAVTHLAQGVFAMTPQELEALETNVGAEVPRLLAKAVVFMQTQTLTQLGRIIPQMLQRHTEVQTRHSKNVDAFYQAWPSIDRKHDAQVRSIAQTFRQLNPAVPTDKMIETIGPFILMQLGLPLVHMTRAGPGPATGPARPTPPRPNGQAGATHFTPAAPGAVTVHQTPVDDPFAYMGAQSSE